MTFAATTLVTLLRGTETNDYDDEVDSQVAVRSGIPAAIIETTSRQYMPAEGQTRTVHSYKGRLPPNVDVRTGDRVRDEQTQAIYVVTDLHRPANPAIMLDWVLALTKTT